MLSPFGELLSVGHKGAFQFFSTSLCDVLECEVRKDEFLYTTSILAHYSQVSCDAEGEDFPCPRTLVDIFDKHLFVEGSISGFRGEDNLFETVACQTLLLTGFFRDQMRRRHNVTWFVRIGAQFYLSAAIREPNEKRAELLRWMSSGFPFWADRCARLQRELRDRPYLLQVPTSGGVQ